MTAAKRPKSVLSPEAQALLAPENSYDLLAEESDSEGDSSDESSEESGDESGDSDSEEKVSSMEIDWLLSAIHYLLFNGIISFWTMNL